MLILAVDTALTGCSAALVNNGELIASKLDERKNKQAETLVTLINELLDKSDFSYKDIDLITSTIGPGSFTGLRVGISAIEGISLVIDKPTAGITTLEALSYNFASQNPSNKQNLTAIIDARRQQLYIQKFSYDLNELTQPELIDITDIEKHISGDEIILSNWLDIEKTITNSQIHNSSFTASDAALLSAEKLAKNIELQKMTPLYIREPDAEKPKKLFV